MKILAVSHEFPPIGGGGANACYYLTKGFVQKGHQVTLVTANYRNMEDEEKLNGVHIVRVNSKRAHQEHCSFREMLSYLLKAMPVAEKLQKKEKFDVCLVFFGIPSGPIGYVLKKKYGLPYVIRFGGGDIPGFQERFTKVYKLLSPAIRAIWRNADALIANSQGLKDMALAYYSKKAFEIICNGVDTEKFYPIVKEETDEFKILFVSRLIERKGLQHIIPDLKQIQNSTGKKIKLIVVGDGPYRETLERLVKENEAGDMVEFKGQKSKKDIIPFYQHADLFILPSAKEGMPNVVLEAMACGLPIVMTPCEGSRELVKENGIVVETGQFKEAVIDLVKDTEKRQRFSKNSRNRTETYFSWDSIVVQYLEMITRVIQNEK